MSHIPPALSNRAVIRSIVITAVFLTLWTAFAGDSLARNLVMVQWYGYATTLATAENGDASYGSGGNTLRRQLTSACASGAARSGKSSRNCLYSDMASLLTGTIEANDLHSLLARYGSGSFEQVTLANFGGEYYYDRGNTDLASILWTSYLPEELLIYHAHTVTMSNDLATAAILLGSIPDKHYDNMLRAYLGQVLVEMANHAFAEGDFANAELYWRRAIKQWPDRPSYYVSLSRALGKQARWEESAMVLDEAIRLRPGYAAYYVYKSQALVFGEKFEGAATAAERALELEPDNELARDILDQIGANR